MKKIISILLSTLLMTNLCISSLALDMSNTPNSEQEFTISTVPMEQLLNDEYWTILYDETTTTPFTLESSHGISTVSVDAMYTRLTIGYNRPDKRLAVGIMNYVPSGTPYFFYSMSGTIRVVDEESYEVIISGQPFSTVNILPDTSISTEEAIENIGLFKGEQISVTVSGTCTVSSDIGVVPFSQTAHCTVSV